MDDSFPYKDNNAILRILSHTKRIYHQINVISYSQKSIIQRLYLLKMPNREVRPRLAVNTAV